MPSSLALPKRALAGRQVGAIGLGCMGMSWAYAASSNDDVASIATIYEALEQGVTLFDTADVYGEGHNERLVGRALAGRWSEVTIATKCGFVVDDASTMRMHRDGTPEHIHRAVRDSLDRLGTDRIDLYWLHRVDENVPLAESWGAMSELVGEGLVGAIGLCEVTLEEARVAHAIHPVSAIQSEMSLWTRDPIDSGIEAWCQETGAALVAFSPLGRGFLTDQITTSTRFEEGDFRAHNPRFTSGALGANEAILDVVRSTAAAHGVLPAQVALSWLLARGDHTIPIPGTRSARHLESNLAAAHVTLSPDETARLDALPKPVGGRY